MFITFLIISAIILFKNDCPIIFSIPWKSCKYNLTNSYNPKLISSIASNIFDISSAVACKFTIIFITQSRPRDYLHS